MLKMEQVHVIRHQHANEGKSIRQIARQMGLHRSTVRKYLAVPEPRRLDVFGSVARGEVASDSDLDLLVEFKEPSDHPAKRFFGLLHRLEDRFHCKIDLLTPSGLRNPYVQRRIFAERVPVYISRRPDRMGRDWRRS